MFEIPVKKRIKQLFCSHNFFSVALSENYQEIANQERKQVVVYECIKCEQVLINKKK